VEGLIKFSETFPLSLGRGISPPNSHKGCFISHGILEEKREATVNCYHIAYYAFGIISKQSFSETAIS
jgi:hypothetical protein